MRNEYKLCLFAGAFLVAVTIVYYVWSLESTGTTLLVFSVCAYLLLASYFYLQWKRRHGIDRPEDRLDADQSDGAGEVGFFPASSMWPAGMGLGAASIGVAMIYGSWYWLIAGILMGGSIIGFAVEAEAWDPGPDDPGTAHPDPSVPVSTVESRVADAEG